MNPAAAEPLSPDELAAVKAAEAARIAGIENVYGGVVAIYGKNRQGGGSGVLIDPDGYALTNFHVVAATGEEGLGGLADGKLYPWKLIGFDPGGDLALIRLSGQDRFPCAPLGNSDHVRVGQWAMAMGNPFVLAEDQTPTVTLGVVSGVGRYQKGAGGSGHMLEYGNCLQIDSSINPGNSGGPLFDLAGRLLGINGRGSFEERGRVNVGLGYAISIEQCKNFLPDLLAAKVALHATLNATFRDREGAVICDQIHLDSEVAKLGMALGDRLIAFNGVPVRSANHFQNLILTLPAGWPVEVVFEHEGQRKSGWVRLEPLIPEELRRRPPPPATTQPAPATQPTTRPARLFPIPIPGLPRRPQPQPPPGAPATQPMGLAGEPGKIRNEKLNREAAQRVVLNWLRWRRSGEATQRSGGFVVEADVFESGTKVGTRRWDWGGPPGQIGLSGSLSLKLTSVDAAAGELEAMLTEVLTALAFVPPDDASTSTDLRLEGGDRAGGQRSYRVRAGTARDAVTLWFSVTDGQDRLESRLLKASMVGQGNDAPALVFEDYRAVAGVQVPHRWRLVKGLAEQTVREFVVTRCQPVPAGAATQPAPPSAATQPVR